MSRMKIQLVIHTRVRHKRQERVRFEIRNAEFRVDYHSMAPKPFSPALTVELSASPHLKQYKKRPYAHACSVSDQTRDDLAAILE